MAPLQLDKETAAAFLLHYHSLLNPQSLEGKDSVLSYIKKTGCIQFDPLNICARNPDLVLQSRIQNYEPQWLDELLYQDRVLIDGWDKMMSIYPMDHRPFFARVRQERSAGYLKNYKGVDEHLDDFLKMIEQEGPLSSLDIKHKQKVDWAWGPSSLAKAALESLFFTGNISIHHRENSRRIYDLSTRLIPEPILKQADPNQDFETYRKWHVLRRIKSAGIAGFTFRDFWYGIVDTKIKDIKNIITELMDDGILYELQIEGSDRLWYIPVEAYNDFTKAGATISENAKAVLLAPLDNMMWNRELLEDLFNFHYRWEVYTPANKREYGYYVLPILYKGKIIGRCEPVNDRKKSRMILKGIWFEKETHVNDALIEELRLMFSRFAHFLRVDKVITSPALGKYRSRFTGLLP